MSEIKSYRDLEAWQVTMDAVLETYEATADFPQSELYGLTSQIDTQLEVAIRLAYLTLERAATLQKQIVSGRRLLFGLRRAKRRRLGLSVSAPACVIFLVFHFLA